YIDSSLALGAADATSDQRIYTRLNYAYWELQYGHAKKADSLIKKFSALLTKTSNPRLFGFYHYVTAQFQMKKSNPDGYDAHLKKALTYYRKVNDDYQIGKIKLGTGGYLSDHGKGREALKDFDTALKHLEIVGRKDFISICLNKIAVAHNFMGQHEEAIATFLKVIRNYESLNDAKGIARAYFDMGNVYVNLQDFPKAIDCYHQSIAYAEKIGDKGLLAYNYSLL